MTIAYTVLSAYASAEPPPAWTEGALLCEKGGDALHESTDLDHLAQVMGEYYYLYYRTYKGMKCTSTSASSVAPSSSFP